MAGGLEGRHNMPNIQERIESEAKASNYRGV